MNQIRIVSVGDKPFLVSISRIGVEEHLRFMLLIIVYRAIAAHLTPVFFDFLIDNVRIQADFSHDGPEAGIELQRLPKGSHALIQALQGDLVVIKTPLHV